MKLFKADRFVEDQWVRVGDDDDVPSDAKAVVSLKRWREERDALKGLSSEIGVLLEPGDEVDDESDALDQLGLVIIPFTTFTDGRGYSIARCLRDAAHYNGEIRATGDVLLDQLPLMLRCGFDAFEIVSEPTISALEKGHLPAITNIYQRPARGGVAQAGRHFNLKRITQKAAE